MGNLPDIKGNIFKIKRFSVHDGPGIRTAVFLKGCPLNCIWCHSPEGITPGISIWYNRNLCIACNQCVLACPNKALELINNDKPHIEIDRDICKITGDCVRICPTNAIQFTGSIVSVSLIIDEIEKDNLFYESSGGGITLTGGEPLFQPDFSAEILKECKKLKIHTAIETSLSCNSDTISSVIDNTDLFIVDMKISDPAKHTDFTGKSNENIKENFQRLAESDKALLVRIPLINNITDTDDNKKAIISFVKSINDKIPIEYITYNHLTENNYNRLGIPFLLK